MALSLQPRLFYYSLFIYPLKPNRMAATAFQNIVQERQKKRKKKLSEIKCFPPPGKRAAWGFFFGFFWGELKKKNEQARIEIIVFIQSIELHKMEPLTWRKFPDELTGQSRTCSLIYKDINCNKYMCMDVFFSCFLFLSLFITSRSVYCSSTRISSFTI